jgi:hypothetical protein
MDFIRRRAVRHYFGGPAEVTDLDSHTRLLALTTDLSVFGCFVRTRHPFPEGTKITLKITHEGVVFANYGNVAHVQANKGMGIAFGAVDRQAQVVLDRWISQSDKKRRAFPLEFNNAS